MLQFTGDITTRIMKLTCMHFKVQPLAMFYVITLTLAWFKTAWFYEIRQISLIFEIYSQLCMFYIYKSNLL